jgi:hypothetical protein
MAANAVAAVKLLALVRVAAQLADLRFLCASRRKVNETGQECDCEKRFVEVGFHRRHPQ